ncbi:MAG: PQQ-binding-like beta-propeller repeat protein [Planctomycetia bacterium]|nr:PQQ-binding-like beta-propeller repeat protein [Planctomycetia bacterium]
MALVWRPVARRVFRTARTVLAVAAVAAVCASEPAVGQLPARQQPRNPTGFLQPEAKVRKWMSNAEQLLSEDRHAEAVGFLQLILDNNEDYFEPDNVQASFKSKALKLLGGNAEMRKAYQLQFGERAAKQLTEAVETGRVDEIAEVYRRFFHTESGYQAAYLLGNHYRDLSQPLAAAMCYERVQEAGNRDFEPLLSIQLARSWQEAGRDEQARQVLSRLRAASPNARIVLGDRDLPLFADDKQSLDWLAMAYQGATVAQKAAPGDWRQVRGDAARSGVADGGRPLLSPRWRIPMSDPPTQNQIVDLQNGLRERSQILSVPSAQPLVVKDRVLLRTVNSLLAVEFQTGRRVWNEEQMMDDFFPKELSQLEPVYGGGKATLGDALVQRLYHDATYGMLSSDGENVYAVQDLWYADHREMYRQPAVFMARGGVAQPRRAVKNRLVARDVKEGKLRWQIGGPEPHPDMPNQDLFFLGPPLCLEGTLYVEAEAGEEVRLMALDGRTGRLLWSQQLFQVDDAIGRDALRRLSGVSPSYANGLLVCPTSAGAVVTVDVAARTLRWGYSYERNVGYIKASDLWQWQASGQNPAAFHRWIDATAIVADGRVIVTPVHSTQVHCLGLVDGERIWTADRENGLYVAGVHDGKVVIVETDKVRAIELATGRLAGAWSDGQVSLPAGAATSGRGAISRGKLLLPLSTAEIAVIDLDKGQLVDRARSHDRQVPGNLVCYQDSVLAQGADFLDCFYRLDKLEEQVAARLQQEPNDPEALMKKGLVLLDQAKLEDAVAALRRSFELRPDPHARDLLVGGMLESLRADFARNRHLMADVEKFAERPEQFAEYWRIGATSLHAAGEPLKALEYYLRLVDHTGDTESLESAETSLRVRRDRWLRAQLSELYATSGADVQGQMDALLRGRVEAALAKAGSESLLRLAETFGAGRLGEAAFSELIGRLTREGQLLRAYLLAQGQTAGGKPSPLLGRAVAAAALNLDGQRRYAEAAWNLHRLADEFGDVDVGGRTGREFVRALADGPTKQRATSGPAAWPSADVDATESDRQARSVRSTLPLDVKRSSDAAPLEVSYDQVSRSLSARDGLGRQAWSVVPDVGSSRYYNTQLSWARPQGNLLVATSGGQELYAIDLLGTGGPRMLWKQDLNEGVAGMPGRGVQFQSRRLAWGAMRLTPTDGLGNPTGAMGVVTSQAVCVMRGGEILALDPLTGKTVWKRSVETGGTLFGDDEMLFVVPTARGGNREASEALVLRTADGHLLGKRLVPHNDHTMFTRGRNVVSWKLEDGKAVVRLTDPWNERVLWETKLHANARGYAIEERAIAVLEPDGHFLVFSAADGRTEIDSHVEPERSLSEINVLSFSDVYVLISNSNIRREPNLNVSALPNSGSATLVNGHVYGFDRQTGKQLWVTEVDYQYLAGQQASESPVLMLARNVYRRGNNNQYLPSYDVLCLDRRTGRPAYQASVSDASGRAYLSALEIVADPERAEVTLDMAMKSVKLRFTSDVLPIEAPEPKE